VRGAGDCGEYRRLVAEQAMEEGRRRLCASSRLMSSGKLYSCMVRRVLVVY
jgi:hypothetical protein